MTPKKSFLICLKIFIVIFSLHFLKSAFYKWDGFSYFMHFMDFLPELALSFILWTVLGVVCAFAFWLIVYYLCKLYPKALGEIRFEQIMVWLILTLLVIFIASFVSRSISGVGLNQFNYFHSFYAVIGIFGVLVLLVLRLLMRYIQTDKLFHIFIDSLTPLIWLFAFIFIISIPLSFKKSKDIDSNGSFKDIEFAVDAKQKKPNIILLIMDTLTARDMQVYGYNRPTTPFISEWAENATLFESVYASSNWTTPATMTIMTGQRPWTHKIWYRAEQHPVTKYENNIARLLAEHGYDVYSYVQNNHAHPSTLGIKDYFLKKDDVRTFRIPNEWWVGHLTNFYYNRRIVAEWFLESNPIFKPLKLMFFYAPRFSSTIIPETVYNRLISDLSYRGKTDKPFFAWIQVYLPHDLFLPPAPYMGFFGDEEKLNTAKKQLDSKLMYKYYKPDEQKDIDILRKRYDEFILYADQQFKIFMSRLQETIDMSNTVIILTSDHGESFSHGYSNHDGPYLYESLVHVPLIVKMPDGFETGSSHVIGKRIEMKVDQTDIAPTILEIAGLPLPGWIEGRSLVPLLNNSHIEPRPVFSMQLIKNNVMENDEIRRGTIAVWDGDYKMIYDLEEVKPLLFNVRKDPDELRDINAEEPEISRHLLLTIKGNLDKANEKIKNRVDMVRHDENQIFIK